jgi:hypothetical protein
VAVHPLGERRCQEHRDAALCRHKRRRRSFSLPDMSSMSCLAMLDTWALAQVALASLHMQACRWAWQYTVIYFDELPFRFDERAACRL